MRTSQHGNVRVVCLTHRSRVFQHKQGSRFHLLWNPLSKQFKLCQHAIPPMRSGYLRSTTLVQRSGLVLLSLLFSCRPASATFCPPPWVLLHNHFANGRCRWVSCLRRSPEPSPDGSPGQQDGGTLEPPHHAGAFSRYQNSCAENSICGQSPR